ncbi:class I SAM-dependent methyltransferase [Nocardia mangyaensis]|uniref:class I SAM-dependent methyltransferase n=1 Tax=Nocardia mangyaensis TaxID=2213200 RepID=UPI002675168B|nr:class I SAM-dependent methyltransferase [Nocardia mangyaensis]MDO3649918.1 class I SAM-dependent methyltransferase [Nocardia mangyaensis]
MTTSASDPVLSSENLLTDNPALYERTFPGAGDRNARFVHDLVTRFGDTADSPSLLDIGCGTGRDAARLAELGYAVRAVDIAPRMVTYARSRNPGLTVEVGDARTVRTETPVDVLTCLGSTLLHLHDTSDLVAALRNFHRCLRPGGLAVFDMRNGAFLLTDRGRRELLDEELLARIDWEGVEYTSRTALHLDLPAQLLRRRRVWTWSGCAEPVTQHTAWRLLFPQELRFLLALTGFEVVTMFHAPGPLTEPAWPADGRIHDDLTGDRLHVLARRTDPTR